MRGPSVTIAYRVVYDQFPSLWLTAAGSLIDMLKFTSSLSNRFCYVQGRKWPPVIAYWALEQQVNQKASVDIFLLYVMQAT